MDDWETLRRPILPMAETTKTPWGLAERGAYRIQQLTDGVHVHESNVEVWTVVSNASNVPEVSHVNVISPTSWPRYWCTTRGQ